MMIRKLTAYLFALMISVPALCAGDDDYAVSKIPFALLQKAHAIKRMHERKIEFTSLSKLRIYEKYAITILDETGDGFAGFYQYYDKSVSIQSIEGRLFDATGKKIKSLRNKDIEDRSSISDFSLMEDSRVKTHNFYYKSYPYTIEYEIESVHSDTYIFPAWIPQPAEFYAVEQSSLEVICPADFNLRYKSFNYTGEPAVTQVKNDKVYKWEVKKLPAIEKEYAAPPFRTLTTSVFLSPEKFRIGNYEGNASSWKRYGQFFLQLNAGRDKLPESIKQKVHELTDKISDTAEKVKLLYNYLQRNTRYISIQLGIGGLQPFEASYVAEKSYGDCKALSNYMYALLKEANIRSSYTLIQAGRGEHFFMPDFPSDQFNHIILFVPMKKDTMWLECTSQTLPAGYLGGHTDDRFALAIDESGGTLVHTPKYRINENEQVRNIQAKLDETGNLHAVANTKYTGRQQDELHMIINELSRDKVKEVLNDQLDFATYDLNDFKYNEVKAANPVLDEKLDISVSNYATITGKRLFIVPNLMTRSGGKLANDATRRFDLVFYYEYRDVDSVVIEIPEGYELESGFEPVSIDSKFGKYNCSAKLQGNKIVYYRSIERYSGNFTAKDYNALVAFMNAVYKTDRNRMVFVKK